MFGLFKPPETTSMIDLLREFNRGTQPMYTTYYIDRRFELVKIVVREGLHQVDRYRHWKKESIAADAVALADAVLAEMAKGDPNADEIARPTRTDDGELVVD